MSLDRWMDKEDMVHIYSGILLCHKKEWNYDIFNNLDGPRDYNTKWSESGRERHLSHDITHMWNLKHDTNELISKTEINSLT